MGLEAQGPQIRALASDPRVLRFRGSQVPKGRIEWSELSLRWMIAPGPAGTPGSSDGLGGVGACCIAASSPHFTDKKSQRDDMPCPQPPPRGFWGLNPDLGALHQ